MSFDSSRGRIYHQLTLVSMGRSTLSKKPKDTKTDQRIQAAVISPPIPDAIEKYHRLLSYVRIPRFLHWPLSILVIIALVINPLVGGWGYLKAVAFSAYSP